MLPPRQALRDLFAPGVIARVIADITMINAALLGALMGRYVWYVYVNEQELRPIEALEQHFDYYLSSWWLITLTALAVFTLNGFYTRGRMYQHRYKALLIAEAVSLVYLIFSFVVFLGWDVINLPRSVLLPAWMLSISFLCGARVLYEMARTYDSDDSRSVRITGDGENRLLIIGGAGYIGSALLTRVLETDRKVRLLDALLYGTKPIQDVVKHPNLEIVPADFRQVDQIVQAMQGVDEVVHLGGIVGDPACSIDEDVTIEVNLTATRTIADVARGTGVRRFVFASTCSVYGASEDVLNEHSATTPISLYARSKLASERVLLEMMDSQFSPVVLRFATVYGLSGRVRFDLVVNLLTAKALTEGEITVIGGDQWRPFVHVDDAALGVFAALEAPISVVRGEIFNVGSNEQNKTIDQVAQMVQEKVPSAKITRAEGSSDPRNYRVDFRKIGRVIGYSPRWTLEGGIDQVADAMRSGLITDYRDVEYSNQEFLSSGEGGSAKLLMVHHRWTEELLEETGRHKKVAG